MRHSDVRITMNTYGMAERIAMRQDHWQIVRIALGNA